MVTRAVDLYYPPCRECILVSQRMHAHALRATLLTPAYSETGLQVHLDHNTYIPEAGPLCPAHPSLTQSIRSDVGGIWAVRHPPPTTTHTHTHS